MIQVTIAQTAVRDLKGTAKVSGKPYHLRIQTGYAHTLDADGNKPPFPEKFELMLNADQAPYPVGDYMLGDSSIYVDRDGRMAVSPHLVQMPAKRA